MIIWRGWGSLALLIAALFQLIGYGIFTLFGLDAASDAAKYTGYLMFLPAAVVLWIIGKKMNKPIAHTDQATGKQVISKARHSLFFIPIEYWAIIYILLSIGMIIAKLVQ